MLLTFISYIGTLAVGFAIGGYTICYIFVAKGYITRNDHDNTIEEVVRCLQLR